MLPDPEELSSMFLLVFSSNLISLQRFFETFYTGADRSVLASENSIQLSLIRQTTVILSYDTLLTFSREVDCIWRRKLSVASTIYILQRYGALVVDVINLLADGSAGPAPGLLVRVVPCDEWQLLTLIARCIVVSMIRFCLGIAHSGVVNWVSAIT